MKKITVVLLVVLFVAIFSAGFMRPYAAGNDVLVLDTPVPVVQVTPAEVVKPTNPPPHFDDPIEWPDDLDELYRFVEEGERGYTFEACASLQAPFVSWDMVLEIKSAAKDDNGARELWIDGQTLRNILLRGGVAYPGVDLRVSEKRLFGALISAVLGGDVGVCGQDDGKPIIYGPGVQWMIDHLMPVIGVQG